MNVRAHAVVLLLVAGSTRSDASPRATGVNSSVFQQPTREVLAALALHASTSSTRAFEKTDWVLPDGATMTSSELVDRLKEMQTPLRCTASLLGAQIALTCEHEGRVRRPLIADQLTTFAEQRRDAADSALVLVRVGSLFRLVDVDVVLSFLTNYRVLNTIMGLSTDDSRAHALGAIARLSIGPGGEASLEEANDSIPPH